MSEGDVIKVGQDLCHVSVGNLVVGVESQHAGVLAEVRVPAGDADVAAGEIIAVCVDSAEDYTRFLQTQLKAAQQSIADNAAAATAAAAPAVATTPLAESASVSALTMTDTPASPSAEVKVTDLLREVKHLINSGAVPEESDFAKRLLSQCRKGNSELLSVFAASFEDGAGSAFDANFFLDNAKDILEEQAQALEQQTKTQQAQHVVYNDTVDAGLPGGAVHTHQKIQRKKQEEEVN